jgi:hypothetical protein
MDGTLSGAFARLDGPQEPGRGLLDDLDRNSEPAALSPRGGEHHRDHASAPVDRRPTTVAATDDPAERDDLAQHRALAIGVLAE